MLSSLLPGGHRSPLLSRLSLAGLLFASAFSLSACDSGGGNTAAPPAPGTVPTAGGTPAAGPIELSPGDGKGIVIGSTIPTYGHPFFVSMRTGMQDEAAKYGAEINVVDGKDDSSQQISAIDNFVVQRVNAIILCPTETETLGPGVKKANSANIPVITVNRTVTGGNTVTYVGADDTDGGRMQGQALMELRPEGAKLVLLQGILGSSPQRNREAGLKEALQGKSSYSIIDYVPYKFQRAEAVTGVEQILAKFPKGQIDAIVAQSDDGALAAADVCAQKGRTEITIIGFNGESDAFKYVEQGKMHATILQDAETQGREAVKATLAHLKGQTVANPQITPLYIISKKNLKEHKPAWQSTSG